MNWSRKALDDVADFRLGKMLDQKKNRGEFKPYLANVNVRWGGFDLSELRVMRFEPSELERYGLKYGDIVMCEGGEPGRCAVWKDQRPTMMIQKALHRIRPYACVDYRFLFYSFLKMGQNNELSGLFTGSTIKHLPREKLAEVPISVPPLPVQQRIADILSAYDDLIENNRRRITLLEESVRLLYREWFVHFRFPGHQPLKSVDGVPEGWGQRALGDLVEVVKQSVDPRDFEADDIHVGLEHIPRRAITIGNWGRAEGLASAKWRFEEGDILFSKIRPYFHKVGFAIRRGLASSDAFVWRVREESDWPLVLCATSSDRFVSVASKTVREGSKMPRADWNVLRDYVILKPPISLVRPFNDMVRAVTQQCKVLMLQTRSLAEARDLILPRLMSGDIAVQ